MSKYKIYLKDTRTDKEYIIEEDMKYIDGEYSLIYLWLEGNYECDCNRSVFCDRVSEEEVDDLECNRGKNVIQLVKIERPNGEEVDLSDWL